MATFADVARRFGRETADDRLLQGVSTLAHPAPGTLGFVSHWGAEAAAVVAANPDTLFLVPDDAPTGGSNVIPVANPRLAYALAVRDVLGTERRTGIAPTAQIDPSAQIGSDVFIGHFTVVEAGAVIGSGTFVDSHTVIRTGVTVGSRVRIGSHVSIGGPGFGYETTEDGTPIRIGHLGGVVIDDDVEIGSHVTIAQGTIEPTRIGRNVKIDDCVFIAHNVQIGEAAFVIAGAEISGSVVIGPHAWISPEVSIIQKVTVGERALVGIGAVVVRDVPADTVVAGVPAKPLGPRTA